MTQKETRPLTRREYDMVFTSYHDYLNVLALLADNKEIHEDQRNKLRDAGRNPLMLNKLYYK